MTLNKCTKPNDTKQNFTQVSVTQKMADRKNDKEHYRVLQLCSTVTFVVLFCWTPVVI